MQCDLMSDWENGRYPVGAAPTFGRYIGEGS
jgi:hypothetical protein